MFEFELYLNLVYLALSVCEQRGRPPVGARKGWQTPTHDEVLDNKRREEAQYR